MKIKLAVLALMCVWCVAPAFAQESKKYANNGIAFEYLDGWVVTEKPGKDTDEIALANADADTQITVIAVKKDFVAKKPEDLRKQVADPWMKLLTSQYAAQKIILVPAAAPTTVGASPVDGMKFTFIFDDQLGTIESFWTVLEKKAVLVYMIRPDRTAAKAAVGWDLVRKTLSSTTSK